MENESRKVSISGQRVCKRTLVSLWGLIPVTPPTTPTTTEHPTLILTSDLKPVLDLQNSPELVAGEVPGYSQCCQGALEQGAELPDCSEYLSTLTPLYHGFCFFFIIFHTLKNNTLKLWDLKCPITHTHTHSFVSTQSPTNTFTHSSTRLKACTGSFLIKISLQRRAERSGEECGARGMCCQLASEDQPSWNRKSPEWRKQVCFYEDSDVDPELKVQSSIDDA